jgi:hypothetical protein
VVRHRLARFDWVHAELAVPEVRGTRPGMAPRRTWPNCNVIAVRRARR